MPLKPIIDVKCPCCREVLEIDVAKERVIAHRKGQHLADDRKAGEDSLSVAFRNQRSIADRALNDFDAAAANLKKRTDADRIFDDARRKALDDGDDAPPGPKRVAPR